MNQVVKLVEVERAAESRDAKSLKSSISTLIDAAAAVEDAGLKTGNASLLMHFLLSLNSAAGWLLVPENRAILERMCK